jgi:EAL domain-containing protein (putative c-di-GMP-specific phosphodiesterase class I)
MELIRGIYSDGVRRTMVRHIVRMLRDIAVTPLCEGVETVDEIKAVRDLGVDLVQGYLLAKPAFESLGASVRMERLFERAAPDRAASTG